MILPDRLGVPRTIDEFLRDVPTGEIDDDLTESRLRDGSDGPAGVEIEAVQGLRYYVLDRDPEDLPGFDVWCRNDHVGFHWHETMPDHWAESKARFGRIVAYGPAGEILPGQWSEGES